MSDDDTPKHVFDLQPWLRDYGAFEAEAREVTAYARRYGWIRAAGSTPQKGDFDNSTIHGDKKARHV